jgi:SAM-dependent methyltransferase
LSPSETALRLTTTIDWESFVIGDNRSRQRTQSFDALAADYDRMAMLAPAPFTDWIFAQVPAHVGRALDAGCGPGNLALLLAERCQQVIALDISEPMIEIARRQRSRPNIDYRVLDLMSFKDPDGFDVVLSTCVLHHLSNLEAALQHLRSLVRAGGMAVLIDNVAWTTTPSRVVHVVGAYRHFPLDVVAHGWRQARWMFTFRRNPRWLDHLAGDRYISREAFRRRYGAAFPGARFQSFGWAEALVWQAP